MHDLCSLFLKHPFFFSGSNFNAFWIEITWTLPRESCKFLFWVGFFPGVLWFLNQKMYKCGKLCISFLGRFFFRHFYISWIEKSIITVTCTLCNDSWIYRFLEPHFLPILTTHPTQTSKLFSIYNSPFHLFLIQHGQYFMCNKKRGFQEAQEDQPRGRINGCE